MRAGAWVAVLCGALCACSGARTREAEPETVAHVDGDGGAVASGTGEEFGEIRAGGLPDGEARVVREIPRQGSEDGGRGLAVSADASVESAELAWLVAHIADTPDRNNATDGPNARALAARGALGVRALLPLFRRGDAWRAPFGRRVVERVAQRACRPRGRDAVQRVIVFIEEGAGATRGPNDAGLLLWTLRDDLPWPDAALARLDRWAAQGAPCDADGSPPTPDAGSFPDAVALDATATDP